MEVGIGVVVGVMVVVPPPPPELKVEPMSPNLILEKTTWAFGDWFSTSAGTPDVVAQEPRAAPGAVGW